MEDLELTDGRVDAGAIVAALCQVPFGLCGHTSPLRNTPVVSTQQIVPLTTGGLL